MKIDSSGLEKALTILGQLLEDRGHHYEVVAKILQPTQAELHEAKNWCMTHDVSVDFAVEIQEVLETLHATA